MTQIVHDEAAVLARLRAAWDQALQGGETLDIRIQMLTRDGQPGQPLAYDIVERTDGGLATYTLVELPEAASEQLGLGAVGPDEAQATLWGLLSQAREAAGRPLVETTIRAYQPAPTLGITWGFHRLPDGDVLPFESDYRHWFTISLLLAAQRQRSGEGWQRLSATLEADGRRSLSFG